jgi:hypothetical protein
MQSILNGGAHLCFAVLDDEPLMAQLVSDMLGSVHVSVEVFSLGAELLQSANLLKFKSIILDLSLPDIDGFDLMDKLAQKCAGMPIVLISGHDDVILRAARIYGEARGLNMLATLGKPFTRGDLLSVLGWSE